MESGSVAAAHATGVGSEGGDGLAGAPTSAPAWASTGADGSLDQGWGDGVTAGGAELGVGRHRLTTGGAEHGKEVPVVEGQRTGVI